MFLFSILIGAVFSTLAALCAFVITYEEYLKHYPDKRRPFLVALRTALAAFVFFMVITVLVLGIL